MLAFLPLLGIPPTIGFFGKFALFPKTIHGGNLRLAVVAAANTAISLICYARVRGVVYFGAPPGSVRHCRSRERPLAIYYRFLT